ncbi:MAG: sigma-70 family RNA polymerase sigma factor [Bacilli bacterium]|nr:sigma-70 family RNA polymerase sigma factor [Bacilli bacterium]
MFNSYYEKGVSSMDVVEVLRAKYQEPLELSDSQFEELLIKVYRSSYKNATDSEDLMKKVMRILEDNLEQKLYPAGFHNPKDSCSEITSFIENNFVISDNVSVNSSQLRNLSYFMNSKGIKEKHGLYTKLLEKSSKFLGTCKSLISGSSVEADYIYSIACGDRYVINMLKAFCNFQCINIDSSDLSVDNYSSIDLYYNEISKTTTMSKEDFVVYFLKYKEGDMSAFDEIVKGNLLLVLRVINSKFYCSESDRLDFIQVGNLGLIDAIRRYDINKGVCFSTYASHVIYGYIIKYISSNKVISPSASDRNVYYKIKGTIDKFQASFGRKPTISELKDILSMRMSTIRGILDMYQLIDTISLNSHISWTELDTTNGSSPLEELISSGEDIYSDAIEKISKEEIRAEVCSSLTETEKFVIKHVFAFDGGEPLCYEKIALLMYQSLGLSKPYTRQNISIIYKKAIDKIREIYLRHGTPEEQKILMKRFY